MYVPRDTPPDAGSLPAFLAQEHRNIARAISSPVPALQLSMSYVEPSKLQDGLVVLADGTSWNPGSGGGFYGYRAGAWRFLG